MSQENPVLKARFVVIGENHQTGQFQEPRIPGHPEKGMKLDFEPIVSVTLVAQAKIDGSEDINEPTWRSTPNAKLEFLNGRTAAFEGFKPGQHYLVTLTPVANPVPKADDDAAEGGTLQ